MKKEKGYKGIFYGIVPHIGCILFILAAILGSTALLQLFKPILMNKNIFYYLIGISLLFATLSSLFYLKKNNKLSISGIKSKRKYLITMYGLTIGTNLIFFFFIFPLTANIGGVSAHEVADLSLLKIKVNIPCSGHTPLITNEIKTIKGVNGTKFIMPNTFEVYYDSSKTSEKQILSLEIFKRYPAKIISN
jgi:hypothetical protein